MKNYFFLQVYSLVKKIPRWRVATYSQIATLLGQPRSAQAVGWALHACPDNIPWQRVINKAGMISIINERAPKTLQVALLKTDGIKVIKNEGDFFVDLKIYRWLK